MRIDIVTIFPQMFDSPFRESIAKRAIDLGLVKLVVHNLRDYTHDRHRTVDDYPYGGGPGMVLKPEPFFKALEDIRGDSGGEAWVALLSPQGYLFNQKKAQELAQRRWLILLCGHYEGVDERVGEHLAQEEISIGDYVLSGGELAAMVVVDAVARLLPGALGSDRATVEDSHSWGLLEYPQYTRPQVYRGWEIPSVLVSGNHAEVARWHRQQAIVRTSLRRPDLLRQSVLSEEEKKLADEVRRQE